MNRDHPTPPVLKWVKEGFTGLLIIDDIEERGVYGIEAPYSQYEKQVIK